MSNAAAPAAGTRLCRLDDIPMPGARSFRFREGETLFAGVVLRFEGELRGYVDSCPHFGWPLGTIAERYFTRENDLIICAGHGALFRPLDGVCISGPCTRDRLTPWPVRLEGDDVVVA